MRELAVLRELQRRARWQLTRVALSWPEKVRMAEQVRASVEILRAGREVSPEAPIPRSSPRPKAQGPRPI